MQNHKKQKLTDLTHPLTESTPVFPGDPSFKKIEIASLHSGSCYNLSSLHMGNHTGTHIDFPAHVNNSGKTSSDYTLDDLSGEGIIIEYPKTEDERIFGISKEFIHKQKIKKGDIIFFKTSNGNISLDTLSEEFVFLSKEGAKELVEKKVSIVGIDYMSIDSLADENLSAHHALLGNNIPVVENLCLNKINPGRYYFYIVPLNIPGMDGQQVRVFARRL